MLSEITLGQFFPGKSLLHRLDPRTKLVLLFAYIVTLFLFSSPGAYAVYTALAVVLVCCAGISWQMLLKSLKPIWWIVLFTFGMQLLSVPGEVIYQAGFLSITWEGVRQGLFLSLRLILLILLSSLLMFTTSPLSLTEALERLLGPLKKIGLPAHELALMMTIALRFVPTLIRETDKIMKAQQARGSDFSSGSILQRAKKIVPILVPLFISAFRRADELAMAMEARCYHGSEGRTRMKKLVLQPIDYVAAAGGVCLLVLAGLMRYAGV